MDPIVLGLIVGILGFSTIGTTVIGLKIIEKITARDSLKCCICQQEIDKINEKHKTN